MPTQRSGKRGWAKPLNSRKYHYFVGGRALCARWLYVGTDLEDEYDDHAENCAACKRAVAGLRAYEAKEGKP